MINVFLWFLKVWLMTCEVNLCWKTYYDFWDVHMQWWLIDSVTCGKQWFV